jgi:hypothetical protein
MTLILRFIFSLFFLDRQDLEASRWYFDC